MNIQLSYVSPAEVETECLVVPVLDAGEKDQPRPKVAADPAVEKAAADVIASGEVTGKAYESVLIHRPQGLKAKRLLLVGGGKAGNFSTDELRQLAGAAVRFLKPKRIRSFAFLAPPLPARTMP